MVVKVALVVTHLRSGGVTEVIHRIIQGYLDSKKISGKNSIEISILTIRNIKFNSHQYPCFNSVIVKKISWKNIRSLNFDVWNFHGAIATVFGWLLKFLGLKQDNKFVSTVHSDFMSDFDHSFKPSHSFILKFSYTVAMRHMDENSCVAPFIKTKYQDKTLLIKKIIPNTAKLAQPVRRKDLFEGPHFNFVFIGGVTKLKNVKFLVEVFNLLPACYKLKIYGDGGDIEICESLVADCRKEDIKFFGWRDNANDELLSADCYISASMTEGSPMAVLDALGAGIPVALSLIPGHIDLCLHLCNNSCLQFKLESPENVASKIIDFRKKFNGESFYDELYDEKNKFLFDSTDLGYREWYINLKNSTFKQRI